MLPLDECGEFWSISQMPFGAKIGPPRGNGKRAKALEFLKIFEDIFRGGRRENSSQDAKLKACIVLRDDLIQSLNSAAWASCRRVSC
jgi:hypothetical protein